MLTREQNELVTRTGPATPGGELLRRYWQPVALASELPANGAPLPVRVLSEDLVLFRDDAGQPGLLGLHCAHRGCDLSYGRIEDGGLRCLYHGWLYDRAGRCLDQPGEPAGSTFKDRVRQRAYPVREVGDLLLAYLGPGEPPLLPPYEFLQVPAAHRWVFKARLACNYLQGNEGNFDPQHLSFLHRMGDPGPARLPSVAGTTSYDLYGRDLAPTIATEEAELGLRIYSVRRVAPEQNYVRISYFILPNLSAFPGALTEGDGYSVHWHVPIDDTTHWKYMIFFRRSGPIERETLIATHACDMTPGYRPLRNASNRYGQDREEQRTRSFTGMGPSFQIHDLFATESQGAVQDRTAERLGTTDRAIILTRQMLLRAIEAVQEGRDPPHVLRGAVGDRLDELAVRSEAVPATADWRTFWRQPTGRTACVQ